MSGSRINPNKKSRGRPKTDTQQMGIRLEQTAIDAIDVFVSKNPALKSRPAAIRLIVQDWLIGHGYLKLPDE